jgi:hypothetical protein
LVFVAHNDNIACKAISATGLLKEAFLYSVEIISAGLKDVRLTAAKIKYERNFFFYITKTAGSQLTDKNCFF